jgi:hypothetical protein
MAMVEMAARAARLLPPLLAWARRSSVMLAPRQGASSLASFLEISAVPVERRPVRKPMA